MSKNLLLTISHFSDFHLGGILCGDNNDVTHEKTTNITQSKLKKAISRYENSGKDDYIIITGDIYHSCYSEFRKIAELMFIELKLLENFKNRILCCPGNHDCCGEKKTLTKSDDFFYYSDFPCCLEKKIGNTTFYFVGLDSCIERYDSFSRGLLGETQLEFLRNIVKEIDERKKDLEEKMEEGNVSKFHKLIIYVHHCPFQKNTDKKKPMRGLVDKDEFLKIIEKGKCDVLLCGHTHKKGRQREEEKKFLIPVILNAGMLLRESSFSEIQFFDDGSVGVRDLQL